MSLMNLKVYKSKRDGGVEWFGVIDGTDNGLIQLLVMSNYKCELTGLNPTLTYDDVFELCEHTKKYID